MMSVIHGLAGEIPYAGQAHTTEAGPVLDRIMVTGVIRTPVSEVWSPEVGKLPDGTLTRMELEVMPEIGRRIEVEGRTVTDLDGSIITWDQQLAGKWGRQPFDVVNSLTSTEQCAQDWPFAAIPYSGMTVLAVHHDNPEIRSSAEASGGADGALGVSTPEMHVREETFGIEGVQPFSFRIGNSEVLAFDHKLQIDAAITRGDDGEIDGRVSDPQHFLDLKEQRIPIKVLRQPRLLDPNASAIQVGDDEHAELFRWTLEDAPSDGTLI